MSLPSALEQAIRRPARALLSVAVEASRAVSTAKGSERRKAAQIATKLPAALRAALLEDAIALRLDLAVSLEHARRAAVRLAGLDAALGAAGRDPVAIVGPAVGGAPARVIICPPAEVEAAAAVWRRHREALRADPDTSARPTFPDPPCAAVAGANKL